MMGKGKGYRRGLSGHWTASPEERFWSKVERRGADECWPWRAYQDPLGYGALRWDGKVEDAHRVSWRLANGPIPEGLGVLHRCDNPECVNPQHLFLGTPGDNARDRVQKGRNADIKGDRNPSRIHRLSMPRGEGHTSAKLTEQQVRAIRNAAASGTSCCELGRQYGLNNASIGRIVRRITWRHVT